MDKLRAMAMFVTIVDRGSLTAAADASATSLPSVVRSLAALERALGVRLLNRTTRRIALTDEGREYYERCRRVLADVDEAEDALLARRQVPRGRLRLTAPVMFGRMYVAPLVSELLAEYPELNVELVLLDRVVDLIEEGLDVGIRIGHLSDSSMVALPVGQTRRVICASPGYLREAGTPRGPAELSDHRCVAFSGLTADGQWPLLEGGRTVRAPVQPVLTSNQFDAVLEACLRGVGLAQFLCYQVRALYRRGSLRRVLRDFEPAPVPIQIVYPSARLLSANIRTFVDRAVPRLRARQLGLA